MIVQSSDLELIRTDYPNLRLGLAAGSFDLLHGGHLDYLEWAWENCDLLIVAVRSDQRIRQHKGPDRPVIDQARRPRHWQAVDSSGSPTSARHHHLRQRLAPRGSIMARSKPQESRYRLSPTLAEVNYADNQQNPS